MWTSRPSDSLSRRVSIAAAWLVLVIFLLLLWSTVARISYAGAAQVERVGTASVMNCTKHGPISVYGIGNSYACRAEVRWSDGDVEVLEFRPGQLAPGDQGRQVPVYYDSSDGRGEGILGRNGSARFSAVYVPAMIGFGFATAIAGLIAVVQIVAIFRPRVARQEELDYIEKSSRLPSTRAREQGAARQQLAKQWPLTGDDKRRVGHQKILRRTRFLSLWAVLAAVLVLLSTIPRFDAPHALDFVSPWPEISQATLLDISGMAAVIVGLLLAVLLWAVTVIARDDAARVIKFGPAYLLRAQTGNNAKAGNKTGRRFQEQWSAMKAREPGQRKFQFVIGGIWILLTVWAAVRGAAAVPAGAPFLVWLACFVDAILFALLAVIWFSTIEGRATRLDRLLSQYRARQSKTTWDDKR